jgi:hypothetical protein
VVNPLPPSASVSELERDPGKRDIFECAAEPRYFAFEFARSFLEKHDSTGPVVPLLENATTPDEQML